AQQAVLQQMQLLGTNNIIVKPVVEQFQGEVQEGNNRQLQQDRFSPGLSLADMNSIVQEIPHVEAASPEIIFETSFIREGRIRSGKLIGVNPSYFDINGFTLQEGKAFTELQVKNAKPVCIIGADIQAKFFPGVEPIGKKIKAGNIWFTVVGVLERRNISTENIENLG